MRYKFAREGIDTIIGHHYEVGAFQFDSEKEYIVTWQNDFSNPSAIMGSATDVRREDDGWITAEVTWNDRMAELEDRVNKEFWLTTYANEVQVKKLAGVQRVRHCNLKALFLAVTGANPYAEDAPDGPWTERPIQNVELIETTEAPESDDDSAG